MQLVVIVVVVVASGPSRALAGIVAQTHVVDVVVVVVDIVVRPPWFYWLF